MKRLSSRNRLRIAGTALLMFLAACTAVDRTGQVPGMVPVGQAPQTQELPIKPQPAQGYAVLNKVKNGEHADNGNHYGHVKQAGKPVEESSFVKSEAPYTAPLSAGSPPPPADLIQASIPYLETTYGPVDNGSIRYAVLPMAGLRTADNNSRSITFIADEARIVVADLTGNFQANRIPFDETPDSYNYMRVYFDAVTGQPVSTLLSRTPIEDSVTPTPAPTPAATPTPTPLPTSTPTLPPGITIEYVAMDGWPGDYISNSSGGPDGVPEHAVDLYLAGTGASPIAAIEIRRLPEPGVGDPLKRWTTNASAPNYLGVLNSNHELVNHQQIENLNLTFEDGAHTILVINSDTADMLLDLFSPWEIIVTDVYGRTSVAPIEWVGG